MLRTVAIVVNIAALILLSSCTNYDYRREVRVIGARGKFFVSQTGTAIPLSDATDTVDYEVGSKNLRIFTGNGGKLLSLYFDRNKELLIISYCGGRIESVESSFVDVLSTDGEGWKIYRAQVINNPGFTFGAMPICSR